MSRTTPSQQVGIWRRSALVALLMSGSAVYSQAGPPVHAGQIAVETDLVVLPVRVTDRNGNFVAGLTQQQFRVYENGRQQRITLFRQEDVPVTVGLVVDHSRSMGPKLWSVAKAVSAFARSSNPDDEMFVVDFSDKVSIEEPKGKPFTHDPELLARAVSEVSAEGMTALYDAVAEGLNHLQFGHMDKKALIVVSDGGDNASRRKYSEILGLARRSQAIIYAIGLVGAPEESEQNPGLLRQLCEDTGGLAFFPAEGESVAEISATIARDLREQYTIGFSPKTRDGNSFRKLRVEVSGPGLGKLKVRTRSGYFAASRKQAADKEQQP